MNITITPGAATTDAEQIDAIVAGIQEDMEILNKAINKNIPDGIETSWSDTLKSNWNSYYGSDVPEALAGMKLSAANLRAAVDAALKYSGE